MKTLKEVEEITEIKADNLRQRIHRGTIKATKLGRDWFISDKELLKLVDDDMKCTHCGHIPETGACMICKMD